MQGEALSASAVPTQPKVRLGFLWKVSFIAGLGGILYGFDMGVIAAALVYVRESFQLSTIMQELVVSVVLVGAMGGALSGGVIADRIGRRATLLWGSALFLAGSVLAFAAPDVFLLIVSPCASRDRHRFHLRHRTGVRLGTGAAAIPRNAHRAVSIRAHRGDCIG